MPSACVRPIERRTPYSHTASEMFYVIDIRSRKNIMKRAMAPIIVTKRLNTTVILSIESVKSFFVNITS